MALQLFLSFYYFYTQEKIQPVNKTSNKIHIEDPEEKPKYGFTKIRLVITHTLGLWVMRNSQVRIRQFSGHHLRIFFKELRVILF